MLLKNGVIAGWWRERCRTKNRLIIVWMGRFGSINVIMMVQFVVVDEAVIRPVIPALVMDEARVVVADGVPRRLMGMSRVRSLVPEELGKHVVANIPSFSRLCEPLVNPQIEYHVWQCRRAAPNSLWPRCMKCDHGAIGTLDPPHSETDRWWSSRAKRVSMGSPKVCGYGFAVGNFLEGVTL
jgi:hypothetical protein